MTGNIVVPSLGPDGWCADPAKMGDILFSHFLLSDYSQSNLFLGQVSSLAYLIHKNAGSLEQTASAVQSTLITYFGKHFNNVNVVVDPVTTESPATDAGIRIYIEYTDNDGNKHSVGKLATLANGEVSKVITIFNGE